MIPTRRLKTPLLPSLEDGTALLTKERRIQSHHYDQRVELVKKETELVNRSKVLVYFFILLAAAVTATFTFFVLKLEERKLFHDEFEEFFEEIVEYTEESLRNSRRALTSMANSWTSYCFHSKPEDCSFPMATLPHFGVQARNLRFLGQHVVMAVAPVVSVEKKQEWERYALDKQKWIDEDLLEIYDNPGLSRTPVKEISDFGGSAMRDRGGGSHTSNDEPLDFLLPIYQISPPPVNVSESPIMLDLMSIEWFRHVWKAMIEARKPILSPVKDLSFLTSYICKECDQTKENSSAEWLPHSLLVAPIFSSFEGKRADIVGVVVGVVSWRDYFTGILDDEAAGMVIEVGQAHVAWSTPSSTPSHFFLTTNKEEVLYLGRNFTPQSDMQFLFEEQQIDFNEKRSGTSDTRWQSSTETKTGDRCIYILRAHAEKEFTATFSKTRCITLYTIAVVCLFVFTGLVFVIYDVMVQIRQAKVLWTAEKSTAIVHSLFPKRVAQKMMGERSEKQRSGVWQSLMDYDAIDREGATDLDSRSNIIADLFPETTILFADLHGFTAWSSMRDPIQVFHLLETIYSALDDIASQRGVFKVETVGNCYVAVCGLPEPEPDHALVMALFANDCLQKIDVLTKDLEVELGPDTSALCMRFGLHSGPVTAGVLRGKRARFQLFGDSVNTASRIETTGVKGRIHVSEETAALLTAAGKRHWLRLREDKVVAKGKGELTTYWLAISSTPSNETSTSTTSATSQESDHIGDSFIEKKKEESLIEWHTETLVKLLKAIVFHRERVRAAKSDMYDEELDVLERQGLSNVHATDHAKDALGFQTPVGGCKANDETDIDFITMNCNVVIQIRNFVTCIASGYNKNNPFHNFEHASHVVMSVVRLLTSNTAANECTLDDPLARFALVLAALVHDVDHPAVPNQQLVKERPHYALIFANSFAERNSIDIAWELLMREEFKLMRRTIYQRPSDFYRFRQFLVHAVLVTDIMDKDLQTARKLRWKEVFGNQSTITRQFAAGVVNRKKTAVFEHVIQASDIAHAMQHWCIYRHWNACLFREMYEAWKNDRSLTNPAIGWYRGEIGFFEFYVLPLAIRLKECRAFGAYGDELYQYAVDNLREWKESGVSAIHEFSAAVGDDLSIRVAEF